LVRGDAGEAGQHLLAGRRGSRPAWSVSRRAPARDAGAAGEGERCTPRRRATAAGASRIGA